MSNVKNKQQKKEAAILAVRNLQSAPRDFSHLESIAEHMIDPSSGAVIMPQRAPGRLGAATFPLVHEFLFNADTPEGSAFSIIAQPDLNDPLRISRLATVPDSADVISGTAYSTLGSRSMTGEQPCSVMGQWITGVGINAYLGVPLSSAVGGTFTLDIDVIGSAPKVEVAVRTLISGAWSAATLLYVGGGGHGHDSVVIAVNATITTAISIILNDLEPGDSAGIQWQLTPLAATLMSCGAVYSELVMDSYQPDWAAVLKKAKYAKVVACDMLVTYEGSTLDNSGSIAVGNVDNELTIPKGSTMYDVIASLPFDKYRGRLASEGQTEGGAHWHFVPNSPEQLEPNVPQLDIPMGIVGVNGISAGQVVRIECHYTLNFYSQDPSYKMVVPPSAAGLSSLLWHLRTEVPLVSSNDRHILKKLKSTARKGAKLGQKGMDLATSPEALKAMAMMAALL